MRTYWKFIILNTLTIFAIAGVAFIVPDTPVIKFVAVSAIAIFLLNYSLARLPSLRTGTAESKRKAWKEYRSSALIAAVWAYLVIAWDRIGLIVAAVTAASVIVGWLAVRLAEKAKSS